MKKTKCMCDKMIQKIFHTIWVGDNPFPEEYKKYLETWKKHHPDWEFMFWTDENIPLDKFRNKELYLELPGLSQKADVAQYELLYLYGGVYIDADFECFKNIESLTKDYDAWGCGENELVISTGIMGFQKEHPLLIQIMDNFRPHIAKYPNEPPNVTTGPIFLTETIGLKTIKMFPTEYFYPYSFYELHRKGEEFPNAYGAHHWGAVSKGGWLYELQKGR